MTKLEVKDSGKVIISRWININSPVGFCLTELLIVMLIEETDGYTCRMGAPQEQDVKRTHSLFIDDLKVYQDDHKKLEVVNEIIMKASMDTGACYGLRSWKK